MADLADKLRTLGSRALKLKDVLQTEEATKHSLILPFIAELGYDIYDPTQVVPEFIADFGKKKGEKVDYALLKEGKPVIIIECKHCKECPTKYDGQMFRYFTTLPSVKFAILTNGIKYLFYTDIEEANKPDETPFFEFDITDITDYQIEQLKQFHKNELDVDKAADAASELKYMKEMTGFLKKELTSPSDDFITFIIKSIDNKKLTTNRFATLSVIAKKAIKQVADDMFTERIARVLDKKQEEEQTQIVQDDKVEENNKIITTQEEIDGYNIIKALLRKEIDLKRIGYKDYQGFFGIRLDDMLTKTFCKLFFNNQKKLSIRTIYKDKTENVYDIECIDDIYKYADDIINAAKSFL